jgi:hypothetical protein
MNRVEAAENILADCPMESIKDHQIIALRLLNNSPLPIILASKECERWPETRVWLKAMLKHELVR